MEMRLTLTDQRARFVADYLADVAEERRTWPRNGRPGPPYSPEFNPIEFLWRTIKKQATHLRYFPTFAGLTAKVDCNPPDSSPNLFL